MTSCNVCCETFNKSTLKEVICEFSDCAFSACKTCVRTYLLGTSADPHCMNCKKSWNDKFLIANLNRVFCDKEYKCHRKDFLLDREISKLPESMHLAERQKKIDVEIAKEKAISNKMKELTQELNILKFDKGIIYQTIYKIKNGIETGGSSERRKFIMACSNNDCRGYLSTQYKCELCDLYTCPDCHELVGYTKTDEHTCNPDNVASAEMIKKETKPCPQCGIRIFKISGCSQMWCTECKVAFDYNTLKIDTGTVHNPHYYAHMAQLNNGQAPRNPQDVVCGGLISVYELQNHLARLLKQAIPDEEEQITIVSYLRNIHRVIAHITHHELYRGRLAVRELQDFEDIRVKYILGQTEKKDIRDQIYRRDIKRKEQTELLHIYELYSVIGIENFNMLMAQVRLRVTPEQFLKDVNEKILVLDNLRDYCNGELEKISATYNHKIIHITDLWEIITKKSKIASIKS